MRAWRLLARLWRQEPMRLGVMVLGVIAVALVLALMGTGTAEIRQILSTLALGALVLAVSSDHRTVGAVVVAVLTLSLVGTLAGPRWSPAPATEALVPETSDTAIGGAVTTAAVGTYGVAVERVWVTQADGETVPALLRRPVGAGRDTPGVVFLHGAGTHTIEGFAEQADALASAGATTLVPSKPMEDYSLTERDYTAMAADYARSVAYLRALDGVDPARVGLYAESEGGYPGVVLAGTDPDIAFLVLASAPVVALREQATFAAGSYLRRVGVPDALLTLVARVLGARELPGDSFGYADFDARPYEERIAAPVLMIYGTGDSSMPLIQGPARIRASLGAGGNDRLTVRYYRGANHGLKLGRSTDGPLAPGVARDLARWVLGLPQTADAAPHVAGAAPVQDFWARSPGRARWYASGDLMLAGVVGGPALLAAAGLGGRPAAAPAGAPGAAPARPRRPLVDRPGPERHRLLGAVPGLHPAGGPTGHVLLLQLADLLRRVARRPVHGTGRRGHPGQARRADLARAGPPPPRAARGRALADRAQRAGAPVRPGGGGRAAGGPGVLGAVPHAAVSAGRGSGAPRIRATRTPAARAAPEAQ